jgi:hypothetical protein
MRFLLLLLVLPLALGVQRRGDVLTGGPNQKYDGRFVFTRIRYGSAMNLRRGGGSWAHDYPRADRHLPLILEELTSIAANIEGSNVLDLDDPELLKYPIIYLSEPGFWTMTDRQAQALRMHILKGGFIIFDDFEHDQWYNFEAQLRRALPESRLIEIDVSHPIFHSFFEMKTIDFPHPLVNVTPSYYGIFEDNDPKKRLMGIVNYNNDIAEYWEWSDTGMFAVDVTSEAYKLGVNYIVYALTH